MVPQKGKALVLLRTLNDLLRRLSKMGNTTIFCGRILTFLSGVFPLGERSGVNLRGEYGPVWEGVMVGEKTDEKSDETTKADDDGHKKAAGEEDTMEVDVAKLDDGDAKKTSPTEKAPSKKEGAWRILTFISHLFTNVKEFYNTFWSLQLPFSKPPLFANPATFPEFKEAVTKVLPSIKEATAKERAMMGSSRSGLGSLKRKREPETGEDTTTSEYFFAKFLTSPELLDLEVRGICLIISYSSFFDTPTDCGHPLPSSIRFSTPHTIAPPSHFYEIIQSYLVHLP
jgi:THO complex subunit 1 transcription elongation factor